MVKSIIPSICAQNVDSISLDIIEPTSSHPRWVSHTALPSTLFRSDLSLFGRLNSFNKSDPSLSDVEKTDKESVGEFS